MSLAFLSPATSSSALTPPLSDDGLDASTLCLFREEWSARPRTRQPSRVCIRGHQRGFGEENGRRRLGEEVVELGGVTTVKVRAHPILSCPGKSVQLLT
jgi:hypothetical protein